MATQATVGRRASLEIGTTANPSGITFNEVRNWSIVPTQEMIDASSCDSSGWNEYIPGQRGFVFRAETVYAPTGAVGQDISRALKSMLGSGSRRLTMLRLRVFSNDGLFGAGQYYTAIGASSTYRGAYITNMRVGGRYDTLQLFEVEITGDGVLTYSSA